jgi:hypothetical protein
MKDTPNGGSGKKIDLTNVKNYKYNKYGKYANKCPKEEISSSQ